MKIEDDNGISALLKGSERRLCGGLGFTEGPIWVATDNALIFSDIPGNTMYRWREGMTEAEVYRKPSGWSNGITLDLQGRLVACEHGGRRVSRMAYDNPSEAETLADSWDAKPLNSPNDVVVHSTGAIFFTDPTYGADTGRVPSFGQPGQQPELGFQGVYRLKRETTLELAIPEGFTQPNGLAFSPDETVLYVGDSQERLIWRYVVSATLDLSNRALFVDQRGDPRRGAPDGMKVDTEGRLWTTGAGGISVHAPDGKYLGVFELDEHAANLTFGGPDYSTLFMTAGTSVFAIETNVTGCVPGSR